MRVISDKAFDELLSVVISGEIISTDHDEVATSGWIYSTHKVKDTIDPSLRNQEIYPANANLTPNATFLSISDDGTVASVCGLC